MNVDGAVTDASCVCSLTSLCFSIVAKTFDIKSVQFAICFLATFR